MATTQHIHLAEIKRCQKLECEGYERIVKIKITDIFIKLRTGNKFDKKKLGRKSSFDF